MKLKWIIALCALLSLAIVGCGDSEDVAEAQRTDIVRFLTSSHTPRLVSVEDISSSLQAQPPFFERIDNSVYRYIANYYDADRITRKQVGQGDEVTLTYTAYIFNGRAPAIEDVYDTNDVLTLEQLRMAGLNSRYWSVDPLTVKIGGGDIIKGLELSLVGCREGDVVEAYITSDDAYGKDVVGIVPEKTPVAWFYTIESVGAAQ